MVRKIALMILIWIISGCMSDIDEEALLNELYIEVDEEELILIQGEEFDPLAAIEKSVGSLEVIEGYSDLSRVGKFEVEYLIRHDKHKSIEKKVSVEYTVFKPLHLTMKDNEVIVGLNEQLNLEKYIESYSGDIYYPAINTTEEGDFEVDIQVTLKGETLSERVLVHVMDKTPKIFGVQEEFKVRAGNRYDLFKGISAFDYLGNEIEVEVIGDWNSKKVGHYPLQYHAKDDFGNSVTKDFIFVTIDNPIIMEKPQESTSEDTTKEVVEEKESSVLCPNAFKDKNLPCDAITTPVQGIKQFYGPNHKQDCLDYGYANIESSGAIRFYCAGMANNMGVQAGMDFNWIYE